MLTIKVAAVVAKRIDLRVLFMVTLAFSYWKILSWRKYRDAVRSGIDLDQGLRSGAAAGLDLGQ